MFHLYPPFLFLLIIAGSKSNKKASAQKRTKDRPRGKTRPFLANPFLPGHIDADSLHMMWQDGFPRCGSRIRREGLD